MMPLDLLAMFMVLYEPLDRVWLHSDSQDPEMIKRQNALDEEQRQGVRICMSMIWAHCPLFMVQVNIGVPIARLLDLRTSTIDKKAKLLFLVLQLRLG